MFITWYKALHASGTARPLAYFFKAFSFLSIVFSSPDSIKAARPGVPVDKPPMLSPPIKMWGSDD
jgi:hypothetical protein